MLFGVIFIFNDFRAKHSEIQSGVRRENELIQFFEVPMYLCSCVYFASMLHNFFRCGIILFAHTAEVILAQSAIILYGARYRCRIQKLCYEI